MPNIDTIIVFLATFFLVFLILSIIRKSFRIYQNRKTLDLMEKRINQIDEEIKREGKSLLKRAKESAHSNETGLWLRDTREKNQATTEPSKTIFRDVIAEGLPKVTVGFHKPEEKNELFVCRKVSFGTNGNFKRYEPVGVPLTKELYQIMLNYYMQKSRNND